MRGGGGVLQQPGVGGGGGGGVLNPWFHTRVKVTSIGRPNSNHVYKGEKKEGRGAWGPSNGCRGLTG